MDLKELTKKAFSLMGDLAPSESELKNFEYRVQYYIDNPGAVPRDVHNHWMVLLGNLGWTYGELNNPKNRTSISLIPFHKLNEKHLSVERKFHQVVLEILKK